jgi:hypothetical protein
MNRIWCILDWNVRGINSQTRWDDIYRKVDESNCNIICLQETKRDFFDQAYLRKFCPRRFNQFAYVPSIGNSGGLITIWNGSQFTGQTLHYHNFEITVELTCTISNEKWVITNIYGPTSAGGRTLFANWLLSMNRDEYDLWMILGDFNLIRCPENRNRAGGDNNNMLLFNNIIQHLDLEEIPLKGRAYSLSNMQQDPLLEKLDWIFTSSEWTSIYPDTMATPLSRLSSDHVPIQVKIGSSIPKANILRFEDFWIDQEGFSDIVTGNWYNKGVYRNPAHDIAARF